LQLHCGSPADAHCGQALEQQQLPPGLNSIAWAAAVREPQQLRCPFTFMISCQVAPDSMPRIISASCSVSCLPPVAARAAAEPSAPSPALVPSATRQRQEGEGIRALRSRRLLRACTHVPTAHTQAWGRNWQAAGGTGGRLAAAAAAALRTYDGLAVCGGCCLEYRGGTRHQQLRKDPRGLRQQGKAWWQVGAGRRNGGAGAGFMTLNCCTAAGRRGRGEQAARLSDSPCCSKGAASNSVLIDWRS
jgi:hypothetical protein